MKASVLSVGAVLAGLALSPPGVAQSVAPLSYIQPLPPSAVEMVQQRLRSSGTYSGAVDGVWGPDSVAALQQFQSMHQLQVTGNLNQATTATLGLQPMALLSEQPASPATIPSDAQQQPRIVRAVQMRLRELGYYTGAVDGIWGPNTQSAMARFQQGRGLQPNGQLNAVTMDALGLGQGLAFRNP